MSSGWQTLGGVSPDALVEARLQLHYAAQLVSSLGTSFLEPRDDDSHPNLGWLASQRALAGRAVGGVKPFRGALDLADLRLVLLDGTDTAVEGLTLGATTLDEAYRWLDDAVARFTGAHRAGGLVRPPYELPDDGLARGASFSFESASHFEELARAYGNSHGVLQGLVDTLPGASEVRCWPHHFDLATLVTVESDASEAATQTIGIGFSPGDGDYAEPYWYVSPWPYPESESALPRLPVGHWHTRGYTAAVLTATALLGSTSADEQPATLSAFLDGAIAASHTLHGA